MKVIGLDGKEYNLKTSQIEYQTRSSFHIQARELIKKVFPVDMVLEEVGIPGSRLKVDFVILMRRVVFEIQGSQHYEFNDFFHKDLNDFNKSTIRDKQKIEWCSLNNFFYVELDSRDTTEWEQRIKEYYKYRA